jgi:carbon storage regulator
MRRRQGEAIVIGDNIEIQILDIGRTRVKIGITAPREITVTSHEVRLVRDENLTAARLGSGAAIDTAVEKIRGAARIRRSGEESPVSTNSL